ncbi:MAG: antibiotic biosynthesis monooxygenase [Pararhodobacter sp.]|nr:antibiotic biosynthesis monooxygenase [Pararhodobacter sp.]
MVRLSGRLICATREEALQVQAHLAEHVRRSRAEPGCLAFEIRPTRDPMVWQVDECFADGAALEAHRARTLGSPWWAATREVRREFRRL